jgi:DNA-binding MarR family transcriptional regulator
MYRQTLQANCIYAILIPVNSRKSSTETGLAWTLAAQLHAVSRKLKLRLHEHGGGNDLTPSQVSVLLRLEKDGSATVSSLARAEGMRPQSMSAIVTPLQESGLVSGAPDPGDGRQTLMSLTPRCLKLIREGRAAKQDWLTTTISRKLSVHEQEKLQVALELLTRLVED